MNKKEVAHIRKQFKLDNHLMQIYDILNVYIMKETNEIYHWERSPFGLVDREKQELYMGNFKKLLTGMNWIISCSSLSLRRRRRTRKTLRGCCFTKRSRRAIRRSGRI